MVTNLFFGGLRERGFFFHKLLFFKGGVKFFQHPFIEFSSGCGFDIAGFLSRWAVDNDGGLFCSIHFLSGGTPRRLFQGSALTAGPVISRPGSFFIQKFSRLPQQPQPQGPRLFQTQTSGSLF